METCQASLNRQMNLGGASLRTADFQPDASGWNLITAIEIIWGSLITIPFVRRILHAITTLV